MFRKLVLYFILSHSLTRSVGYHRWLCNDFPPPWYVYSCPCSAAKPIPAHSLILSFDLFYLTILFSFTVSWIIVGARPENRKMWPNHITFIFLTMVMRLLFFPIFLQISSFVTWCSFAFNLKSSRSFLCICRQGPCFTCRKKERKKGTASVWVKKYIITPNSLQLR